jgi:hypothetical protein
LSCLVLSAPAFAGGETGDFDFNETTGLINIPVARVAPAGSVQLSIGAQNIGGTGSPFGIDIDDKFVDTDGTVRAIGGLPGRVEVSVMGLHGGILTNNTFLLGAKWLAVPDAPDHPAFDVGIQSIGVGPDANNPHPTSFDTPSAFGVVSHSFPLNDEGMALDLHGGIGTGRLRDGFAGAEFHFNPVVSAIGEYDGTLGNFGLRFNPTNRFEILTTAQVSSKFSTGYGFLLSYRFGPTEDGDVVDEELYAVPEDLTAGTVRVVLPEEANKMQWPAPSAAPVPTAAPVGPVVAAPVPVTKVVVEPAPVVVAPAPMEPVVVAPAPAQPVAVAPAPEVRLDPMEMPAQPRPVVAAPAPAPVASAPAITVWKPPEGGVVETQGRKRQRVIELKGRSREIVEPTPRKRGQVEQP